MLLLSDSRYLLLGPGRSGGHGTVVIRESLMRQIRSETAHNVAGMSPRPLGLRINYSLQQSVVALNDSVFSTFVIHSVHKTLGPIFR
jgi:hypothetical protein